MKFLHQIIPKENQYYEPIRKYTSKVYGFGLLFGFLLGVMAYRTILTFWWT